MGSRDDMTQGEQETIELFQGQVTRTRAKKRDSGVDNRLLAFVGEVTKGDSS